MATLETFLATEALSTSRVKILNNFATLNDEIANVDSNHLALTGGSITGDVGVTGTLTATKVVGAYYNDYAEFFERGEATDIGDIIALDESSDVEKYVRATDKSNVIVGVHSGSFSHIIGGKPVDEDKNFIEENLKNYIPVALVGRVDVKFSGDAKVGMLVVPSSEPGIGREFVAGDDINKVVGTIVNISNFADNSLVKIKVR